MFSKLSLALCALLFLVTTDLPARSVSQQRSLARVVQDTRNPPCTTCSRCHSQLDKTVCANAKNDKYHKLRGIASYYGGRFHGRRTASGERFNKFALTAAHKTLPLGTRVHVRNLTNNRSVVVTINDRGPYTRHRIIDLSQGAARAISMAGTSVVEITILGRG